MLTGEQLSLSFTLRESLHCYGSQRRFNKGVSPSGGSRASHAHRQGHLNIVGNYYNSPVWGPTDCLPAGAMRVLRVVVLCIIGVGMLSNPIAVLFHDVLKRREIFRVPGQCRSKKVVAETSSFGDDLAQKTRRVKSVLLKS